MNRLSRNLVALFLLLPALPAVGKEAVPHGGFTLEPDRAVPWWRVGDTVAYRLGPGGPLPDGIAAVEGIVTDLAGREVARVRAPRAALASAGWTWTPEAPGYYEVAFRALDGQGNGPPLGWTYTARAPNGAVRDFTRDQRSLAVLPPARPPVPAPGEGQFGVICDVPAPDDIALARLVGLDTVRLLIPWGALFTDANAGIESVRGEQHWETTDAAVDAFAKAGFTIYAQFLYTPAWASPHPEEMDKVDICVRRANAYAPADTAEFGRFVGQAAARYGNRIHYWEVWNEPSMPGGSCFWADTPESYVRLLQAAHDAVKKAQPDGRVAIGGIGENASYLAFYDRVLALGGGADFDILSLHGGPYAVPGDGFRAIEAAHGVAPKDAFQTEWHAILQGNLQSTPVLSEEALSFQLLTAALFQLKAGVQKTILFEMKNLTEKEAIPFAIENKWFTHSSGIFRRFPRLEPRHPAVVFANFLELCGRRASFVREIQAGDRPGTVAVQLDTARGPLLALWSEDGPLPAAAFQRFAKPGAALLDWEGKTVPLDPALMLKPRQVYYLADPDTGTLAEAATADRLVSPQAQALIAARAVPAVFRHPYVAGKIVSPAVVPDAAWIADGWKRTSFGPAADLAFSARAAVGVHADGVDVVVEARDPVHAQDGGPSLWEGDSVQIAIDCAGTGQPGGNMELVSALSPRGPESWKIAAADPHGDIPTRWSPGNGPARYVEQRIVRRDGVTRYEIRIPWSELFPLRFDPSRPLRLSIAVNDNDGAGRAVALGWGGGIVGEKDPSLYGEAAPPAP